MTETEKTIEYLERLTDEYPDKTGHIAHAIAALRAVKKLRDMVGECRGGGCTRVAVECIEELLP